MKKFIVNLAQNNFLVVAECWKIEKNELVFTIKNEVVAHFCVWHCVYDDEHCVKKS